MKKPARTVKPLTKLRKICLALPEAHEVEAWEAPTFRVKNKIFAMYAAEGNHHHDARPGVWIKSKHTVQEYLLHAAPTKYFKPPYVGPGGWTGAYLDKNPDWEAIGELILDAYRQTAPKKLLAKLED
jgi:hypothetical protein